MQTFDSPVRVRVHSYRHRLADPDGVSAKAAIDGLVEAKILRDDSAVEIEEVSYRQTLIPEDEEERTEILVIEVERGESEG